MILTQNMIANAMIWIVHIMSASGLLSQIFLNYKIKSTTGLSNIYISAYIYGYIIHLFYVFCLDLPIACKVMTPLSSLLVLIIVFQRSFYKKHKTAHRSIRLCCVNFFIIFLLIALVKLFPNKIGHLAGWISLIIWTIYQLPQVFKIYSKKSIAGFSFIAVLITGLQNILLLMATLTLGIPVQSFFSAFRGLIFFSIFCFQFWLYEKKSKPMASYKLLIEKNL